MAICLDGYEHSLAVSMMRSGELPWMTQIAGQSARYLLDHGADLRTGLAGEHVATGNSADQAKRWAAVHFDSDSYTTWQQGTALKPFAARFPFRTVVVDPPYCDLSSAPNVQGVVNWGAHDPGVPPFSRPANLLDEIESRFGSYPASDWIYGTPWSSVEKSRTMGERLTDAVRKRKDVTLWTLSERITDWDLALVTVSEAHSAIEGLWHGIDESHPLHGVPSGEVAGTGVRNVYLAIDELIGELVQAFPKATICLFSMHGMGANGSDAASMFLLGELLYRNAFNETLHKPIASPMLPQGLPGIAPKRAWRGTVCAGFEQDNGIGQKIVRRFAAMLPGKPPKRKPTAATEEGPVQASLDWMPLMAYKAYWSKMPAFALPSFYDGRVRVNLIGRESQGTVQPAEYDRTVDELTSLIEACVDPISGLNVVKIIERMSSSDPLELGETEADLVIVWDNAPLGLKHPTLGTIGPVPYRRTGGHTGDHGFAYFSGAGIAPGDCGTVSSYDVIPSIVDLLGVRPDEELSGRSLFESVATAPKQVIIRGAPQ